MWQIKKKTSHAKCLLVYYIVMSSYFSSIFFIYTNFKFYNQSIVARYKKKI